MGTQEDGLKSRRKVIRLGAAQAIGLKGAEWETGVSEDELSCR